MNRKIKTIISLILLLSFSIAYQNCDEAFQAADLPLNQKDDDVVIPAPNLPTYTLPHETVHLVERASLNWQLDKTSIGFENAVSGLANQCEARLTEFNALTPKFSSIVYDEGLLPGDPKIAEMKNVKSAFDKIFDIAFCAYFASTEDLRTRSLTASLNYITQWNSSYVGDGNPINERFFIKLFITADLLFPKMTSAQIASVRDLATRIETKELAFMATLNPSDNRLKNNWKTRHLMILTFANIIRGDATRLQALTTQINNDITQQYVAPVGFTLSTCANLRSVGAYGSFDLQQRDAFVYHLSGISELAPLMLFKSDIVSAVSKNRLLAAMNITKPYVLNEKTHPEFTCTSVQYDRDKIALDPTVASNWNPNSQRVLYRYTRLLWPETKDWTSRFVTNEYSPWFKILYTGKGDILTNP